MRNIVIGLVMVLLAGCAGSYAELGMGYNDNLFGGEDWDNAGSGIFGAAIEVGQEWDVPNNPNMNVKCRWLHLSHYSAGPPFNNERESSVDHIGCAVGYKLDKGLFQ